MTDLRFGAKVDDAVGVAMHDACGTDGERSEGCVGNGLRKEDDAGGSVSSE